LPSSPTSVAPESVGHAGGHPPCPAIELAKQLDPDWRNDRAFVELIAEHDEEARKALSAPPQPRPYRGTPMFQRSKEMCAKVNGTKPPPRSPELWRYMRKPLLARAKAVKVPLPRPRQRHALPVSTPREPRQRRHVARATSSADPGEEEGDYSGPPSWRPPAWLPCPACGQPLVEKGDDVHCGGCPATFWGWAA
jgi:hypothetical protein